jgi:hypothetical protein
MLDRAWGWWFIHQLNAGYARLRRDPVAWAEELEEQRLWDKTLMDGLEDEPPWEDDEKLSPSTNSTEPSPSHRCATHPCHQRTPPRVGRPKWPPWLS